MVGKSKKRAASPEVFHVEVITKARVVSTNSDEDIDDDSDDRHKKDKKGKGKAKHKKKPSAKWEYLVKWAGYGSSSDTWEPEDNVAGCQRLLSSFWAHVGTDNEDYSIGHMVEATDKFIKREKKYFATEFNNEKEKLRLKREKEERERSIKGKKRRKVSPSIDFMAPRPVSSSSKQPESKRQAKDSNDDEPLSIRIPAKRKLVLPHSSDDDDTPLMTKMDTLPRKMMKTNATDRVVLVNKQTAPERPKIPLPRRFDSNTALHAHKLPNATQGQQAVDKQKQKPDEQNQSPSPTPLFSEPSSPDGPLTSNSVSRPGPDKSVSSSAKGTSVFPLKIPRRTNNPHSKILGMTPNDRASGSGISTKQRLAQGALNPTRPNDVASANGRPTLSQLKTPSNSLMALSFKKSQAPTLSASGSIHSPKPPDADRKNSFGTLPATERHDPTLAALNAPSTARASASMSMSPLIVGPDVPYFASPDHYTMSDHFPEPSTTNMGQSTRTARARIENPNTIEAENFLQSIMPEELSSRLVPAADKPFELMPPRPLVTRKPVIPQSRIPKKWSWSGRVYINAAGGRAEPLCSVTFLDATERPGMTFGLAIGSMEHLDFPSFHDVIDLEAILRACKLPLQYARLAPQEATDGKAMITLAKYMVKKQQVILTPVSMDGNVIAHIVFFPHIITTVCRRLKVPPDVQVAGSLVAVLLPWSISPSQRSRDCRKPPSMYLSAETKLEPMIADKTRWERSIRAKPSYQHAIRMLQFPQWLHKYMSEEEYNRTFTVWWDTGDVKKKKPGMETMLLYSIMEQCRAKNASSLSSDIRVTFVHVGALKSIYKFPSFVERCLKPHILFYTYGTHESIPPEDWGVREIYPCGGVVTFTPSAIMDDPIGVLHRIRQLESHPLWLCYILPSVLGMIVKLHCESEDPLAVFDSGKFPYHFLLTAIEEGDLALLTAPPRHRTPTQSRDKNQQWIRDYWSLRPRDARAILETSVDAFNATYSNLQNAEWLSAIDLEVSRDLSSMQRHPAIMFEYRRYVVLRSERIPRTSSSRDGLEWSTPAKFDFRDDFFPKQT